MPDSPPNTTSIFQIGWPSGVMTLRCAGVPPITEKGNDEIRNVMEQFSSDCQMMLVWFSAVLGSQQAMRSHLAGIAEQDEPFTINSYRPDGRPESVLASVPVADVVAAFEEAGKFERLYARAFVVFVYQTWEHAIRPSLAAALRVVNVNDIRSDLMGELRCLRNWLVHPIANSEAEAKFFAEAPELQRALGMKRGDPSLTAAKIAVLTQYLNNMQVDVGVDGAEFAMDTIALTSAMLAGMARKMEPGGGLLIPTVHLRPYAGAWIVFGDGPTATVHERNCDQAEREWRQLDGGRMMQMPSRQLAQEVLAELGKTEQPCDLACGHSLTELATWGGDSGKG